MDWYFAGGLMIGLIVALMLLRIPIAFAFLLADFIGVYIFMGGHFGIIQLMANTTEAITTYSLVPIPLFVLMGELFFHSGVATRVFAVLDQLLGRVPGRLSYVAIAGGTLFSALSGSSVANTAMMSTTMYPEMKSRAYSKYLSMGPIVATGALAAVIPPSGLAVLLGSLASIDIGKLLLGGIVPGLLMASLYAVVVWLWTRLKPDSAPVYEVEAISLSRKLLLVLTHLVPMGLVIFMVIGLIIFGIATPSESAAFGVVGVLLVCIYFRSLSWKTIVSSVAGTVKVTGMVLMIILASTTFSQILAISGASRGLIDWVVSLNASFYAVLAAIGIILLILGAFMESVAIMLLTVPIFFPLMQNFGVDPTWFGVFMLIVLEAGLITPPFGLSLYVMLGVTGKETNIIQVSKAVAPYLICTLVVVVLIVLFPEIVLYVPGLSSGH